MPNFTVSQFKISALPALAFASLTLVGCTQQTPNTFRYLQQEQVFNASKEVTAKVDMLWVVDNSSSMNVSQQRLRQGMRAFAQKYLKPEWDIRIGVITTDTYLANPAFEGFWNSRIRDKGYQSDYIKGLGASYKLPEANPGLVNPETGIFADGIRAKDQVPTLGREYARLLPGIHDGPIPTLCYEGHSYFFSGKAKCHIREEATSRPGVEACLDGPDVESNLQCVNTLQNNTVHSGKAILSTLGSDPERLVRDFMVNVTTGASGQGQERAFSSVQQLIADNESTETALFRPGSLRVIIFVSDEDDQSIRIPSPVPTNYAPNSENAHDKENCGDLSSCARKDLLISVDKFKSELDAFFLNLDQSTDRPNYFVTSIVAMSPDTVAALRKERVADDAEAGITPPETAVTKGQRYLDLVEKVGNGSLARDIADTDYSSILEAIGNTIVEKFSRFRLSRDPAGKADMTVKIWRADGSTELVPSNAYELEGRELVITDLTVLTGLHGKDRLWVSFQPRSAE